MTDLTQGEELDRLLTTFKHSAFRWECQGTYRVPDEEAPLQRFLAGDGLHLDYLRGWLANVEKATTAGRRFERVRMMADPLTDYLRFEMAVAAHNVQAGEDIRVLSQQQAQELGMPDHDWWLFDRARVAVMRFDGGRLVGVQVITTPAVVEQYKAWQDQAWTAAMPFQEWAAATQ
jgi:hypothetical protein